MQQQNLSTNNPCSHLIKPIKNNKYEYPKFSAIICQNFTHPSCSDFPNPDKHKEPPCSRKSPKRITGAKYGVDGWVPKNPIFIRILGDYWKKVGKEKNVEKGGKSAKCFAKSLPTSKGVGKVFTHN